MPRNGSDVYSKPAGTTAVSNTTIESAKFNLVIDDLVTDANTPRAVAVGGTGASNAAAALVALGLSATAAEINVLDGVTASTAELNILDGVTASTAELNFVDGVTSAIQTQLDAKQAADAQLTDLATPGAIGVIKVSDGTNYDDITPGTTGQVLTGVTGDKPVFGAVVSKQTTNVAGVPSSEFTIPAWATVITIGLRAMNHASVGFVIQLGKSGPTWVTTGYSATLDREGFDTSITTGLAFGEQSSVGGGTLTLIRDSVPGWYSGGNYKVSTAIVDSIGGYRVNQAGDENIDRIRIITTDGSNWISGIVVFAAI